MVPREFLADSAGRVVLSKTLPPGFAQHVFSGRDLSRRATGAVADHKFDRDYRLGLSQIRRPARPKGSACRVYGLCLEIERYTEHLYSIRDVKLAQCAAKN